MIKFISLKILGYFDLYHQKKVFNFLKKINFLIFDIFFDIGAHEGESIILFPKILKLKKFFLLSQVL